MIQLEFSKSSYFVCSPIQLHCNILLTIHFRHQVLPKLRLWEFFCVDVDKTVDQFRNAMLRAKRPAGDHSKHDGPPLKVTTGTLYERFSGTIDMVKALEKFNKER